MSKEGVFHWGSGSPPCIKAMIAIYEKGVADKLDMKLGRFDKKDHKSDDVLAINPRGQFPTMKLDGICINESSAICDYLEMQYKDQGTKLLPADKATLAQVLQRKAELEANLGSKPQDVFRFYMGTSEEKRKEDSFKEEFKIKIDAFREELTVWNKYLEGKKDKGFLVGDEFTMADIPLIAMLMLFVRFGLKISKFENLNGYYQRLIKRPSVEKSWPPHYNEEEMKNPLLQDI